MPLGDHGTILQSKANVMHPFVRKALRLTLAALALFSVAIGVLDIALN